MHEPAGHTVNVPVGVDDNAQHVSDLLRALLHSQVMLTQHHTVNIPGAKTKERTTQLLSLGYKLSVCEVLRAIFFHQKEYGISHLSHCLQ